MNLRAHIRSGDIPVPIIQRQKCRCSLLLALVLPFFLPPSRAATLSIGPTAPDTFSLSLVRDPGHYFYLQQGTDLAHFTPFSMVLGETANQWTLFNDGETPARFFRALAIDIHAANDTDGDGIDDLYEIRHPILNPLDPTDAALDPDNNGQTFLQEYRSEYNLGDGKREAISEEVSVFTTRAFAGPAVEALSEEVSVFATRPFTGPAFEAISEEISIRKFLPTP